MQLTQKVREGKRDNVRKTERKKKNRIFFFISSLRFSDATPMAAHAKRKRKKERQYNKEEKGKRKRKKRKRLYKEQKENEGLLKKWGGCLWHSPHYAVCYTVNYFLIPNSLMIER